MTISAKIAAALVFVAALAMPVRAGSPAIKAMQEFMEFAPYEAGIVVPQQLTRETFESVVVIDPRDSGWFSEGSIPGARNIEWREVLGRMGEIPQDKKVFLFCNTGRLSAQADFALRVAGCDNVPVLEAGLEGWKQSAAFKP